MWYVISSDRGPICLVEANSPTEALREIKRDYYDLLGRVNSWIEPKGGLAVEFPSQEAIILRARYVPTITDLRQIFQVK